MMELIISPNGHVRLIYSELLPLDALGVVRIVRASYVEPDEQGQWWADLALSRGPRLGPFDFKSAALQAETDWLSRNLLGSDPSSDETSSRHVPVSLSAIPLPTA